MTTNFLGDLIGEVCKALLPIPEEVYFGNQDSTIAVCTLSSISLLKELAKKPDIMQDVSVVGRLLSENKGIDSLVSHVAKNEKISIIVLCGKEVWGHKAGPFTNCTAQKRYIR